MYDFNLKVYADKIFLFEGIYKNSDLAVRMHQEMDSMLETENQEVFSKLGPWQTSDASPHIYGTKRSSQRRNLDQTKNQDVVNFYKEIDDLFHFAGKTYFDALGIDYADGKYLTEHAQFHYYNGQEMGPHVDDYGIPTLDPIATGLIYLNNDKVGGDLWFPKQEVLIESKAGNLVIFPCTAPFYHSSTEIKSGEKYHIGTSWVRKKGEE